MSTSWQRGSERLLWWIVRQLSISRKRNQKKKVVGALCFVQFFVTVSVSVWSLYVSFLPAGLYLVNVDWAGAGAHLFLSAFMLCDAPGVLWVVARGVVWRGIRAYVCYLRTLWTVSSRWGYASSIICVTRLSLAIGCVQGAWHPSVAHSWCLVGCLQQPRAHWEERGGRVFLIGINLLAWPADGVCSMPGDRGEITRAGSQVWGSLTLCRGH